MQIKPLQVYMLFTQFLYSTTLGFYIGPLVLAAGFSAWISVVLGSIAGISLVYFAYRLALRRPNQHFGQYGLTIVGRWIHVPLSLMLVFSFIFSSAFVLRELENIMTAFYLRGTPPWAIAALFGICIVRVVRSGAVTLFRSAQGIFIFSVVAVLSIPFLVGTELNGNMIIALFTNIDPPGIWNGMIIAIALFGELTLILFLLPHFAQPDQTMKSLGWAIFTAVVITLAGLISSILLFGPELTGNLSMPLLELIRYAKFGSFFQNLDPLLIIFWLYSMFIKISLFLYVSVILLTHTLGLKDHKPLSGLMTAAVVLISLYMVRTEAELSYLFDHGEIAFLLITEMIPAIYLIVDRFRSSRVGRLNSD